MVVSDRCFILNRFPVGDNSLLVKCYFENFGRRDLLVPDYFSGKRFKLGVFEPFNVLELYFKEEDNQAKVVDIISLQSFAQKIASNLYRYLFMSRVSKTVLNFVGIEDNEVFNLLLHSLRIESYFNFNLLRFWINLATVLGFSIESLKRPGWVNLLFLTACGKDELKNPYCIYLPPREFGILKRVMDEKTKPFEVGEKNLENLERFFFRFFRLQRENF